MTPNILFDSLLVDLHDATQFMSSTTSMVQTTQFTLVLDKGEPMARYIIGLMREGAVEVPWLLILASLIGRDVVRAKNLGKVRAMAADYIEWADNNGW